MEPAPPFEIEPRSAYIVRGVDLTWLVKCAQTGEIIAAGPDRSDASSGALILGYRIIREV
jgi:hypothetical protein